MPEQLKELRQRLEATRKVGKITSALKDVSTVRLAQDRPALATCREYTEALASLLDEVLAETPYPENPLVQTHSGGKAMDGALAIVVFGSDKGFCGAFNRSVLERAALLAGGRAEGTTRFVTVGSIVGRRAARIGVAPDLNYPQPSRETRSALIDELARVLTQRYIDGTYSEVMLVYSRFRSGLDHELVAERLLPVALNPESRGANLATVYEPAADRLVDELVGELVRQMLDLAFLNSMASEDASRRAAMSHASQSAEDLLEELTTDYRRIRQQGITTEMIELTAGLSGYGASHGVESR